MAARVRLGATPTIIGLGIIALVSGLLALYFVSLWADHVEAQAEAFVGEEGRQRGRSVGEALEALSAEYVDRNIGRPSESWIDGFPQFVTERMRAKLEQGPGFGVAELALIEAGDEARANGVVVRFGNNLDDYPQPRDRFEQGLVAIVETRPEATRVFVWGPVRAPVEAPVEYAAKDYHFRVWMHFEPFKKIVATGRNYAAILVVLYWFMLWVVVVFVYLLGRRQQTLASKARERSIRLEAMSSVAVGIAHEVRNPLNGIALNVQYLERLQERGDRTPAKEDFRRVHEELDKIRVVIDNFVSFSRLPEIERDEADLVRAMQLAIAKVDGLREDIGAELTLTSEGATDLEADEPKLVEAFQHLLRNAIESAGKAEEPSIKVVVEGAKVDIAVRIENSGPPVSEDTVHEMFDPFYTTHATAIGLGSTLASIVIRTHGGHIEARRRDGGGLIVAFTLPRRS